MLYACGLRIGETLALIRKQAPEGDSMVITGKGDKQRMVRCGFQPWRPPIRKSLVFRIPHVGKPHRPKVGFGSRADSTVTVSIRPLLGLKRT